MSTNAAVIFDVDGTLVDSNDAHAHAWMEAFAESGIAVAFDHVRRSIGMGGDKLMPHVSGMSAKLWASYTSIVTGRDAGTVYQLQPFYAVAAMPSLHVGAHWMFALWAKRHARRWFLPFALATAATFAGSAAGFTLPFASARTTPG